MPMITKLVQSKHGFRLNFVFFYSHILSLAYSWVSSASIWTWRSYNCIYFKVSFSLAVSWASPAPHPAWCTEKSGCVQQPAWSAFGGTVSGDYTQMTSLVLYRNSVSSLTCLSSSNSFNSLNYNPMTQKRFSKDIWCALSPHQHLLWPSKQAL